MLFPILINAGDDEADPTFWDADDLFNVWGSGSDPDDFSAWTYKFGEHAETNVGSIYFDNFIPAGYSWYSWDEPGELQDIDITAEFDTRAQGRGRMRARFDDVAISYYQLQYDDPANQLKLVYQKDGGGEVTLDTDTDNVAVPFKIRLQAIGTAIKAKVWAAAGAEPGAWNIEEVDANVPDAGKIFIGMTRSSGYAYCNGIICENMAA